jgi:hypothetical protein
MANETEYLNKSEINRKRLRESIKNLENGNYKKKSLKDFKNAYRKKRRKNKDTSTK